MSRFPPLGFPISTSSARTRELVLDAFKTRSVPKRAASAGGAAKYARYPASEYHVEEPVLGDEGGVDNVPIENEDIVCQFCSDGGKPLTLVACDFSVSCFNGCHFACFVPAIHETPSIQYTCLDCLKHALCCVCENHDLPAPSSYKDVITCMSCFKHAHPSCWGEDWLRVTSDYFCLACRCLVCHKGDQTDKNLVRCSKCKSVWHMQCAGSESHTLNQLGTGMCAHCVSNQAATAPTNPFVVSTEDSSDDTDGTLEALMTFAESFDADLVAAPELPFIKALNRLAVLAIDKPFLFSAVKAHLFRLGGGGGLDFETLVDIKSLLPAALALTPAQIGKLDSICVNLNLNKFLERVAPLEILSETVKCTIEGCEFLFEFKYRNVKDSLLQLYLSNANKASGPFYPGAHVECAARAQCGSLWYDLFVHFHQIDPKDVELLPFAMSSDASHSSSTAAFHHVIVYLLNTTHEARMLSPSSAVANVALMPMAQSIHCEQGSVGAPLVNRAVRELQILCQRHLLRHIEDELSDVISFQTLSRSGRVRCVLAAYPADHEEKRTLLGLGAGNQWNCERCYNMGRGHDFSSLGVNPDKLLDRCHETDTVLRQRLGELVSQDMLDPAEASAFKSKLGLFPPQHSAFFNPATKRFMALPGIDTPYSLFHFDTLHDFNGLFEHVFRELSTKVIGKDDGIIQLAQAMGDSSFCVPRVYNLHKFEQSAFDWQIFTLAFLLSAPVKFRRTWTLGAARKSSHDSLVLNLMVAFWIVKDDAPGLMTTELNKAFNELELAYKGLMEDLGKAISADDTGELESTSNKAFDTLKLHELCTHAIDDIWRMGRARNFGVDLLEWLHPVSKMFLMLCGARVDKQSEQLLRFLYWRSLIADTLKRGCAVDARAPWEPYDVRNLVKAAAKSTLLSTLQANLARVVKRLGLEQVALDCEVIREDLMHFLGAESADQVTFGSTLKCSVWCRKRATRIKTEVSFSVSTGSEKHFRALSFLGANAPEEQFECANNCRLHNASVQLFPPLFRSFSSSFGVPLLYAQGPKTSGAVMLEFDRHQVSVGGRWIPAFKLGGAHCRVSIVGLERIRDCHLAVSHKQVLYVFRAGSHCYGHLT